jgi:hypothetical protein
VEDWPFGLTAGVFLDHDGPVPTDGVFDEDVFASRFKVVVVWAGGSTVPFPCAMQALIFEKSAERICSCNLDGGDVRNELAEFYISSVLLKLTLHIPHLHAHIPRLVG